MWTATLYQVDNNGQRASAVVLFTDGVKYKLLETFDLQGLVSSSFRSRIEDRRKQLEDSYSFIDTLDIKTFNLAPDASPTPTQNDIDKQKFFADCGKLQRLQNLVTQGILNGNEKEISDLQATIKAEYQSGFFA